ncbi:beta-glucosidase 17-like [Dorcoceras hygrometricum]|uniref:Beta-glucosidase 17-like n=1 Tax=Dorcoceras hygrometricum TaxID=472368 RepID=A0A2Z7BTW4_9LAMI|nr:beta-glucosidase 17-like [Dorcoceras hygrometricum]
MSTRPDKKSYNRNQLFLSTKPAATFRRCIHKGTSKRRRNATIAGDGFLPKQPTAGIRLLTPRVTTQNDVAAWIRHPRCQQLIKSVALKTLRFNLSKRRRLTSTTGSSNQQLIALQTAVNTKRLTNTRRVLDNSCNRPSAASRFLFKRYY